MEMGAGVVIAGGYLGLTDSNVMSMLVYHPPRHLLPLLWMILDVLLECGSCLLILGSKGVVVSTFTLGTYMLRRHTVPLRLPTRHTLREISSARLSSQVGLGRLGRLGRLDYCQNTYCCS